jgi:hypothetical protein
LYEDWIFGIILKNLANLSDGPVDTAIGIEEDILAPDLCDDVLSTDELPSALDQQQQNIEGDSLQLERAASQAQFVGDAVEFKTVSEFHHVRGHIDTTY